jgi:hypothetical protein
MRKAWIIFGLLLCVGFGDSLAVSTCAALKPDNSKDLVLVGTVTKIYPIAGLRKNWAVAVHVDRVVPGELSGSTFTFTVHSPAMAGLRVRRAYIIKARWVEEGYVVNEFTPEEVHSRTKPPKRH